MTQGVERGDIQENDLHTVAPPAKINDNLFLGAVVNGGTLFLTGPEGKDHAERAVEHIEGEEEEQFIEVFKRFYEAYFNDRNDMEKAPDILGDNLHFIYPIPYGSELVIADGNGNQFTRVNTSEGIHEMLKWVCSVNRRLD